MRIVPFRIPKQVVIPGLVVQVKVVPATEVDETGDCLGPAANADWDYDPDAGKARIRLRAGLSKAKLRYLLIHELQHVLTDYLYCALAYHPNDFEARVQ